MAGDFFLQINAFAFRVGACLGRRVGEKDGGGGKERWVSTEING